MSQNYIISSKITSYSLWLYISMNSMNDANIPYIDDRAIPYLMSDLNLKNM